MENKRLRAIFEYACPSIRIRAQEEIYGVPTSDEERQRFYEELLQNERVQTVLSWQHEDGYFSERFHTPPAKSRIWPHEGCVRFLLEMGFQNDFLPLRRALEVLLTDGWGKECEGSAAAETFGYRCIRAALFAQAGLYGTGLLDDDIEQWIRAALRAFSCIADSERYDDMTHIIRGKHSFRPGKSLPTIYMLRLLAYTTEWRTEQNLELMRRAYRKLYEWLPLPPTYLRKQSGLVAPAGSIIMPINTDVSDSIAFWWFSFYELSARMGMLTPDSPFFPHVTALAQRLRQTGGIFLDDFSKNGMTFWSGYSGMALENDWKLRQRRVNDLTFRSHLLFTLSGMQEQVAPSELAVGRSLGVRL